MGAVLGRSSVPKTPTTLERQNGIPTLERGNETIDLYREAASQIGVAAPVADMRGSTLMDSRVWDGSDPVAYAEGFALSGSGLREAA